MLGEKQPPTLWNSPTGQKFRSFSAELFHKVSNDNIPRLASSFSFYAILSIAPFLVFAVSIAAYVASRGEVTNRLEHEVLSWGGPQMRDYVAGIIESSKRTATGVFWTILSLLVTFYSASNLFIQLDAAVSTIWNIKGPASFLKSFIAARLLAFLSVLIYGTLLLALLTLDGVMGWVTQHGGTFAGWPIYSFLVTVISLTAAISIALRALPRGKLKIWDTVPGAIFTAVVFALVKYVLSTYFAHNAGVYSAAGGVVVLLLFLYYSSMLYMVAVEITYVYAHRYGSLRHTG